MTAGHGTKLGTRTGTAYTTEDGTYVPEHTLYRWECLCGQHGMVWYSGVELAQRGGDRHLIEAERAAV